MYGVEPIFGLKFIIILVTVGLILFSFSVVLRKWLKVEKKATFSYNHLNAQHRKIDWIIRITTMVLIILGFFINMTRDFWFLETYFILFIFIIASETARATMEWKYAANRNEFIFTIVQLAFSVILLVLLYITNFFGLV
ncbi:DUF4181 domain-containing protein [Cytobacillus purgationiresistens]|uniref:DUF4181 domain-containing protein n=1 Tax=Cytobacillus purgationiresistens TaxID=863449 RepID=A0ABU0AN67_9BACI|nr:DUF4181 domain-containing protein [Cytobacillus purgationiresistens]MDQ0272242.1 hypothetical protein [Cytobacillus purgationiresistens]